MSFKPIPKRYLALAQKWLDGTATPEEKEELDRWYREDQGADVVEQGRNYRNDEEYRQKILSAVNQGIREEGAVTRRLLPWARMAAASVVLGLVVLGGRLVYLKTGNRHNSNMEIGSRTGPADNSNAVLILDDGKNVELDSISSGAISHGLGYSIRKSGGELIYEPQKGENASVTYNTIRIPRGGQFRLTLPDGSKVWLNSESSLRFPTVFNAADRMVELTGEAYFEVRKQFSKGRARTFKINVNNSELIEVLGTSFNVMAYTNENVIKTTLVHGSVRVDKIGTNISKVLKPGQQSVFVAESGFKVRSDINTYDAISWKDGLISYQEADVPTIMRYLERRYDVKIVYEGAVPRRSFTGGFSRGLPLANVLRVLELNNIKFSYKQGQITVLQ